MVGFGALVEPPNRTLAVKVILGGLVHTVTPPQAGGDQDK